MAVVQNLTFRASAQLRAELMADAPGDFDFVWSGSEAGESKLAILGQSRLRMARFLLAHTSRYERLIYVENADGQIGEEISGMNVTTLVELLATVKVLRIQRRIDREAA